MKASLANLFSEIGLGQNEGKVYEVLLKAGECSVSQLARHTKIHRRNVYDVLHELQEKGLVTEVVLNKQSHFRAVDPSKLREILSEQEQRIRQILPSLRALKDEKREEQQALLYRDVEGYKNYLRDILRVGANVDIIGAKASWLDERVHAFMPWFSREVTRRKLKFRLLFDYETQNLDSEGWTIIPGEYRFLPKSYSTPSSVTIFGDHVMVAAPLRPLKLGDHLSVAVVIDERLATSFRTWFELMWQASNPSNLNKAGLSNV